MFAVEFAAEEMGRLMELEEAKCHSPWLPERRVSWQLSSI